MFNKMKTLTILSLTVMAFGLSACATISGAGQDIEAAGEAVQDAAN